MSKKTQRKDKGAFESIESTAREAIEQGEKVWLAGLGILVRAGEEGRELLESDRSELFDDLAKTGREFVDRASKARVTQFERVQKAVSESFDKAREQVNSNFDRAISQAGSGVDKITETLGIDQMFDHRIAKSLERLGYPDKKKFSSLNRKINTMHKVVEELQKKAKTPAPVVKKSTPVARKTA